MENTEQSRDIQKTSRQDALQVGTMFDAELTCLSTDAGTTVLLGQPLDEWVGVSLYRFDESAERSLLFSAFQEAEEKGFALYSSEQHTFIVVRQSSGYALFMKEVAMDSASEKAEPHFEESLTPRLIFDEEGKCIFKNKQGEQAASELEELQDLFNHWKVVKNVPVERLWKDVKEGDRPQYLAVTDQKGQEWTAELGYLREASQFEIRLHLDLNAFAQVETDEHLQTIAHDLRAPLANLQNILILQDRIEDEEKNAALQQNAHKSVKRLQTQLNNLLVRAAVDKQEQQKTFLKELWQSVLEDLHFLIEEAQPRLTARFDVEHSFIDVTLLRSIFQNLLSNSLKYKAEGRSCQVALEIYKLKDGLIIRLEDNGQGMDLEENDGLFNPFETMGQKTGTGVGLSLLKEKVEKAKGKIQVRSQLGRGTIFLVSIPEPVTPEQISLF